VGHTSPDRGLGRLLAIQVKKEAVAFAVVGHPMNFASARANVLLLRPEHPRHSMSSECRRSMRLATTSGESLSDRTKRGCDTTHPMKNITPQAEDVAHKQQADSSPRNPPGKNEWQLTWSALRNRERSLLVNAAGPRVFVPSSRRCRAISRPASASPIFARPPICFWRKPSKECRAEPTPILPIKAAPRFVSSSVINIKLEQRNIAM
jgi:hypothetical protein